MAHGMGMERVNLRRLFWLRLLLLGGQGAMLLAAQHLDIALPYDFLWLVMGLSAIFNFALWWRLRQAWRISHLEFFAQLLADVALLTALLYFSGGPENPLVSLYLLPLAITAVTLSARHTWAMASVTIIAYTGLMFLHFPPQQGMMHGDNPFRMHIAGMWLTFVLSAGLIAYFVVKMQRSVHERERELAEAREAMLRDEHIIALGTLAAGAAHELGTPLGTMAVVLRELDLDYGQDPVLRDSLALLRQQVQACKVCISALLASAHRQRAAMPTLLPVDVFIGELIEKCRLLRPDMRFFSLSEIAQPAPCLPADPTLAQAIMNLMHNAADVSPDGVRIVSHCRHGELCIEIRDQGPGVPAAIQARIGEPFFTTKSSEQGLGLGFYLSNASINRLGGKVSLFNAADGGACTRITLPLAREVAGEA